jgi:hypothetical protein
MGFEVYERLRKKEEKWNFPEYALFVRKTTGDALAKIFVRYF